MSGYQFCAAANCPNDAQLSSTLCQACERKLMRGGTVEMHRVERPVFHPETMLHCHGGCNRDLPDEAFTRWNHRAADKRRNRHNECKECAAARRKRKRQDPAVRAREAAIQRTSRLRRLARSAPVEAVQRITPRITEARGGRG